MAFHSYFPDKNWLLRNRPFLAFLPVIFGLEAWALNFSELTVLQAIGLGAAGYAAWTLLEWSAHRAMHLQTRLPWIDRLQDNVHLRHHREPDDLEHSVLRLSASLPLAAFLFGITWLIVRRWELAAAFHAGLLCGYLFYEWVHLTGHGHVRIPGLRRLHRYHSVHHYVRYDRAFGVTTRFWDWLFRTLPEPRGSEARLAKSVQSSNE
jgi:sterol desaturase/sphingolipid hydroxylase (fatty acid hydroxylase superfamily)